MVLYGYSIFFMPRTPTRQSSLHISSLPERVWKRDASIRHSSTRVPVFLQDTTILQVNKILRDRIYAFDSIDYVYVVDESMKLIGVVSIKEVYRHKSTTVLKTIIHEQHVIAVHPETPSEEAAYTALRHSIKAVPIVDGNDVLVGVLLSDIIVSIIYKETREDFLRIAGVRESKGVVQDNIFKISVWQSLKHRVPWLVFGLFGGLFSAKIIGSFEYTLEQNIILATFIPLVVYMSSAVGLQAEAFIIRDLALNRSLRFAKYFFRQLAIISCMAVFFGVLIYTLVTIAYGSESVGRVLGVALTFAILSSVVVSLLVPYTFSRLKLDPANTSGPVATIMQDIISVSIYLSVAVWLL